MSEEEWKPKIIMWGSPKICGVGAKYENMGGGVGNKLYGWRSQSPSLKISNGVAFSCCNFSSRSMVEISFPAWSYLSDCLVCSLNRFYSCPSLNTMVKLYFYTLVINMIKVKS